MLANEGVLTIFPRTLSNLSLLVLFGSPNECVLPHNPLIWISSWSSISKPTKYERKQVKVA